MPGDFVANVYLTGNCTPSPNLYIPFDAEMLGDAVVVAFFPINCCAEA